MTTGWAWVSLFLSNPGVFTTRLRGMIPEIPVELRALGHRACAGRRLDLLSPVVWLCDQLEVRCRDGIADLDTSISTSKKRVLGSVCSLSQSRRLVFGPEAGVDPNDRGGVSSCRVREDLSEVDMVSLVQLVLNDDHAVIGLITAERSSEKPPTGCSAT